MASIIDSFRESFSDNLSFLKFLVFAIPVYYSYQVYLGSKGDYGYFSLILCLTITFLLGILIKVTNNVITEKNQILPSFNVLGIFLSGLKGGLALAPILAVSVFLGNYISSLVHIIPWLDITIKSLVWLIVAAIFVTVFLMYASTEKVKDAFNFKILSTKAGDFIISILFFIIQLLIVNLPTTVLLGYILIVLFGFGFIVNYYIAMMIVFNVCIAGYYFSQLHYELFTFEQ